VRQRFFLLKMMRWLASFFFHPGLRDENISVMRPSSGVPPPINS
jgi:hypothetical protein